MDYNMLKKILLFDLFDTLLKKEWFDYTKAQSIMCTHMVGLSQERLLRLSSDYRYEYMSDRTITNREVSFIHQLHYYESCVGNNFDVNLIDLEWECFKACRGESLIDGVKELLVFLQNHDYHLAIVSNSIFSSSTLRKYMDGFNIGMHFDAVFSSADIGFRKPSPEIFRYACQFFGVSPDNKIIFVGNDYDRDVKGAISAGLTSILYDSSNGLHNCLAIGKLSDLKTMICSLEGNNAHCN